MNPQTAIKSMKEILDDLSNDGNFLDAELMEIRNYSRCIEQKISEVLGDKVQNSMRTNFVVLSRDVIDKIWDKEDDTL